MSDLSINSMIIWFKFVFKFITLKCWKSWEQNYYAKKNMGRMQKDYFAWRKTCNLQILLGHPLFQFIPHTPFYSKPTRVSRADKKFSLEDMLKLSVSFLHCFPAPWCHPWKIWANPRGTLRVRKLCTQSENKKHKPTKKNAPLKISIFLPSWTFSLSLVVLSCFGFCVKTGLIFCLWVDVTGK